MSIITLPPKQIEQAIKRTLIAGLVPYVAGSPGLGKSDIYKAFAKEHNLKFIDIRLSQATPEDLNGYPMRVGDKATFVPFDMFPIEGDDVPEGYDGWFILLDEISSAPKTIQAAAYRILLDREVGSHKLHDRVLVAAAGNKMSDKAVVVQQSTALQSRMVHFEISVSKQDWMEWAIKNNIDYRVRAFIEYKPSYLHQFDPNHHNKTFPCPRTWAFVSKLANNKKEFDEIDLACFAGAVSDGPAVEFFEFSKISESVPAIKDIMAEPETTPVPREASFRFFVTSALIDHTDNKNFENNMKYVARIPEEFQVIFIRNLIHKDKSILSNKVYASYAAKLIKFIHSDD